MHSAKDPTQTKKQNKFKKKKKKGIIAENFLNLAKETVVQVQEAQRVPNRINPKRTTPIHTVIKMAKIEDKERILKAAKEKQQLNIQGNSHKAIN